MNVLLRAFSCSLCLVLSSFTLAQSSRTAAATSTAKLETSDLAAAKIRQTLATERALIASHPNDPTKYIDLAYTLTDAGIGDQARQEALKATEIPPASAFTYNSQAWVLHHNAIGVAYGKGFDYDGSLASYGKALELYPGDLEVRQGMAELLEYNRNGIRYAPGARLDEAIETRRYIKAHSPSTDTDEQDNLIIDLFYAGRFNEALAELASLPSTPLHDGVTLAAIAAVQGPEGAVSRANAIGGDEQKKKDALNFAAEGLWNMRLYPQAAAMLTASLPDTSNSKALIGKIQLFRTLEPYKGVDLPPTDPRYPVQRLLVASLTQTLTPTLIDQCVSHHSFADDIDWKLQLPGMNSATAALFILSRQTGLPQVVIQDILLSQLKLVTMPSNEPGSRILVEFSGLNSQSFFVINEDGSYKVLTSKDDSEQVGTAALYLLHHRQQAEAASLLNWKRDLTHKGQDDDDPLSGVLFARLWRTGESSSPQAIELAAASLLSDKSTLLSLLSQLIAVRESAAKTGLDRDNLDLLLASTYLQTEDAANAKLVARQLLDRYPDSTTAIALSGNAYRLQKNWPAWKSLLDTRFQRRPNDRSLLLQAAAEAESEGDFPRARRSFQTVLDSGHARPDDYNMDAWLSLFEPSVDDQALAAAQQANLLTQNGNFAYLHTLACLYAARGDTAEARQLLLEAMSAANLEEPDSAIWYGFGRIYEQYGESAAAAAAYQHVKKPNGSIDPAGTFPLAQSRLNSLGLSPSSMPKSPSAESASNR